LGVIARVTVIPKGIWKDSISSHSKGAYETDTISKSGNGPFSIPFVVKYYVGDSANGSSNTITITSGMGIRHIFDAGVLDFRDTPVALFYAKQFCMSQDRC
jgi:hypothetical protein